MSVVLSISSQVIRGHVGNSAAVFALQRLGHQVWALPTVILAHHPGHDRAVPRLITPGAMIADFIGALDRQGWLTPVDAVLIGYLGDGEQAEAIAASLKRMRAGRSGLFVALDPVIGDNGSSYVSDAVAAAIRDTLLPISDLITPNCYEFGWLTGSPAGSLGEAIERARRLAPCECLLTSAPGGPEAMVRNLAISDQAAFACDAPHIEHAAHGAGDLISALYLAHRLSGKPIDEALARATAALQAVLTRTARARANELSLIDAQDELVDAAALAIQQLE